MRRPHHFLPVAAAMVLLAGIVAAPAEGEEYAGTGACLTCHEDVGTAFEKTVHGMSGAEGWDGAVGCETCHGPSSEHAESGDPELIRSTMELTPTEANDMCLGCHGGDAAAHWQQSTHDTYDVSCADCHRAHTPWTKDQALVRRQTNELCLDCHQNMRKHLIQRSSHPLRDGLMSCVSCHSPHGSPAEGSIAALTPNDKCYECHADKRGPYLFEHAPVRENCMTCHDPHGSNQTMMLVRSAPRLCQSCHLFGHHQTVPGTSGQVWNVNRSCLNCHPRIHGSNHPSGVIFMR